MKNAKLCLPRFTPAWRSETSILLAMLILSLFAVAVPPYTWILAWQLWMNPRAGRNNELNFAYFVKSSPELSEFLPFQWWPIAPALYSSNSQTQFLAALLYQQRDPDDPTVGRILVDIAKREHPAHQTNVIPELYKLRHSLRNNRAFQDLMIMVAFSPDVGYYSTRTYAASCVPLFENQYRRTIPLYGVLLTDIDRNSNASAIFGLSNISKRSSEYEDLLRKSIMPAFQTDDPFRLLDISRLYQSIFPEDSSILDFILPLATDTIAPALNYCERLHS